MFENILETMFEFIVVNYQIILVVLLVGIIYIAYKLYCTIKSNRPGQLDFHKKIVGNKAVNPDELVRNDRIVPQEKEAPIIKKQHSHFQWISSHGYENNNHSTDSSTTTTEDNNKKNSKEPNITKLWKILVVDDAYSIRTKFEKISKGTDIEVILKEDGQKALDYLMENRPDLIITDIEMPNMNGMELIKEIKNLTYLNNVPVIVISSSLDKYLDLMSTEHVQAFIKKPFVEQEVFDQIYYLLGT